VYFYLARPYGTPVLFTVITRETRDMGNLSRDPTFGNFITMCTEASMQDITVARLQSTRVQTPLSPPLLNVMYCVRVSLCGQSNISCATLKRRGVVVGNLCISLLITNPFCVICASVADPDPNPGPDPPDPHVFGPPGSGSIMQRYGSGSGSGSSPSKKSKKNLDSYCFVTSF
jgi:hypothetical protein